MQCWETLLRWRAIVSHRHHELFESRVSIAKLSSRNSLGENLSIEWSSVAYHFFTASNLVKLACVKRPKYHFVFYHDAHVASIIGDSDTSTLKSSIDHVIDVINVRVSTEAFNYRPPDRECSFPDFAQDS